MQLLLLLTTDMLFRSLKVLSGIITVQESVITVIQHSDFIVSTICRGFNYQILGVLDLRCLIHCIAKLFTFLNHSVCCEYNSTIIHKFLIIFFMKSPKVLGIK